MRTFVLNGMEDAADIENGDVDSPQHDTGGLSGRKFVRTKGFHRGILGGFGRFDGKRGGPVAMIVAELGRSCKVAESIERRPVEATAPGTAHAPAGHRPALPRGRFD